MRVIDSGTGLQPDQLERMFDMFARIERAGAASQSGLGIGLALSRRLAELHGGKLTAFSAGEGQGGTLTLCIPMLSSTGPAVSTHEEARQSGGAGQLSVLVIEDREDVASGLMDWLENVGHRVTVANTGEIGVEAIRNVCPDVAICDLGLPEMDGLGVCRSVRALPNSAQPIMIAMTGGGREEDVRQSNEAGFVAERRESRQHAD